MREIPKKNYIIMLVILVAIVITTITVASVYNNRLRKTSIMYNYLSEIKKKDIDTYLIEKSNIILYISDKYDLTHEEIEQKLKNDMINYNISNYFVYLNVNNDLDFIEKINKKYAGNLNKKIPVLIVFEEGKIKNAYYDLENINLEEITGDIK